MVDTLDRDEKLGRFHVYTQHTTATRGPSFRPNAASQDPSFIVSVVIKMCFPFAT